MAASARCFSMPRDSFKSISLVAILLLGWTLRISTLGQNRFLEDEALYASWGLQIATGLDPMLDREPVDKPPLHPYALALSYILLFHDPSSVESQTVWGAEMAARLPSLLASMAGIALIYALGRELYGETVGLLAALLLALSPFDILFASTAFTDPLMTVFALGALLCASRGEMLWAGVLLGLSAATKQQGVFFLPLVVALGLMSKVPSHDPSLALAGPARADQRVSHGFAGTARGLVLRVWNHDWIRFSLGFAAIAVIVFWWDSVRAQRPGFLEQSLVSYGRLGPARPQVLGDRAVEWLRLVQGFWVSPMVNAVLLSVLALWLLGRSLLNLAAPRPGKTDFVLIAFLALFLVLHWLAGFQTWDRYLLGLVPLAALLAARALVALGSTYQSSRWRVVYSSVLGLALILGLAGPVLHATRSEVPYGGDHGAYDGIDEVASFVRATAPDGAVLYHQWLGYHYRFYLHSANLRFHWYPDLSDLVRDAHIYRREPRYIAFPSWRDGAPVEAALADAGIALKEALETKRRDGSTSFRLYRLEGP
jgi:hypothetical protein